MWPNKLTQAEPNTQEVERAKDEEIPQIDPADDYAEDDYAEDDYAEDDYAEDDYVEDDYVEDDYAEDDTSDSFWGWWWGCNSLVIPITTNNEFQSL